MDKKMPIYKEFIEKYGRPVTKQKGDQVAKQTMGGARIKSPPRPGLMWNSKTHRWYRPTRKGY